MPGLNLFKIPFLSFYEPCIFDPNFHVLFLNRIEFNTLETIHQIQHQYSKVMDLPQRGAPNYISWSQSISVNYGVVNMWPSQNFF